jgi:hypothetical protein
MVVAASGVSGVIAPADLLPADDLASYPPR